MPVIKSAEKKLRQSKTKALGNKAIKEVLRDLISKFRKNPTAKSYVLVSSKLDKAAKTNVIHKNKASRLKSRLSKLLPKTTPKAATKSKK